MQTCREATVLHYALAWTTTCRGSPRWLTLVFCIYNEQAKGRKAGARMPGAQRTLEAYS